MNIRHSTLFTPIKIGKTELKNRVCVSPVSLQQVASDGSLGVAAQNFYLRRAAGGTGLIILGGHTVDSDYTYPSPACTMSNDKVIDAYKPFVEKLHQLGSKVVVQLIHPGPDSGIADKGVTPMAPSAYETAKGYWTREITLEEIHTAVEQFADAAHRAELAGFDGVEIHAAHAYMLPGAFLSSLRNHRTDAYGGDIQHRAKFLVDVVQAIRSRVSPEFAVMLRMSGSEKLNGGNTLEEVLSIIPMLVEAGVSAFDISGGTQQEEPWRTVPRADAPFGVNLPESEAIKAVSSVPVFVVGKINDVALAAQCVDEGKADGVVMGRAMFADSDLVNKAISDHATDIQPCIACGACFQRLWEFGTECAEQSGLQYLPVCKFDV